MKCVQGQGQSKKRFVHDMLGYNFRITNIQSAILYGQLEILPEILDKKNIPSISEKDKEKAKRFHELTLALRYWQNDDKKNAEKCFKEAKIIGPALLEDKDLVGTIAFNIFMDNIERTDWKNGLKLLRSFYKEIVEPKVSGSKKYLFFLLSHYYFLVSLKKRNPSLFLQGIIASPEYFLRVSYVMIKKFFNMVR